MRALPAFPCSGPNCHTEFLTFPLLRAPVLPHAPHLEAAFSREIVHLQTGQCGCQMGTKLKVVLCDENGIGGSGECFGDNDAHLDIKSSQVNTLPKAKSKTRSKQNKDMHKCSSVYSERGVPRKR